MSPGQTRHITRQMGRVPGTDGTHTKGCPAKILYVYWFFLSPETCGNPSRSCSLGQCKAEANSRNLIHWAREYLHCFPAPPTDMRPEMTELCHGGHQTCRPAIENRHRPLISGKNKPGFFWTMPLPEWHPLFSSFSGVWGAKPLFSVGKMQIHHFRLFFKQSSQFLAGDKTWFT